MRDRAFGADESPAGAVVERLAGFQRRLAAEFRAVLDGRLDDPELARGFERWLGDRGWTEDRQEEPDGVVERAAGLAAFTLASGLVLLASDSGLDASDLADPATGGETVGEAFDDLGLRVGYASDPLLDDLPLTDAGRREVRSLAGWLADRDRSAFDRDVLGALYERTLPTAERRAVGQFYTPPTVVDLVTALCIDSPDDVVLDPACGSGAFLFGAFDRLRRVGGGDPPSDLLDQLYGVDVERFPARLAATGLVSRARASGSDGLDAPAAATVAVADFFDVDPGEAVDAAPSSGLSSAPSTVLPERVDAVVGNPPYVRQEGIRDKEGYRAHLHRPGVAADLDERSDLYAYFVTHATEFLADGGRMGLVLPDKWLSVGYGAGLRAFLRDRFRIVAVVRGADRVFDEPLVPTCVTVLERCRDAVDRDENAVSFLRVEPEMTVGEVVDLLSADGSPEAVESTDRYRLVTKRQGDLDPSATWDRYLTAPAVYWALRDAEGTCRLDDLATVTYGTKPGAVEFFFPTPGDLPDALADGPWFRPAVKSIRNADRIRFRVPDADRLVLDVHDLVTDLLADATGPDESRVEAVRAAEHAYRRDADDPGTLDDETVAVTAGLAERGHDALFEYVLDGVRRGLHDRSTCAARRVWFDLGPLPVAPIVASQFVWEDAPYLYLPEPLPVSNALCYVDPVEGVDPRLLAAVLNAAVTRLSMEVHGRVEGGRALQVQVYEREALPVPDVRAFDQGDAAAVIDAFDALLDAQEAGDGEPAARDRLNRAVCGAFGFADRAREVAEGAAAMSGRRTRSDRD